MTQDFPCSDLPHTGQRLVFKKEDIRKAAEHLASLATGEGVLHEKRAPIPLQDVHEDLEFRLEKALSRGCDKLAQVWLSHLHINGQHYPIVIKLFAGRYFECETWTATSTRADFEISTNAPPELFAGVERDAYAMLASAQGSIIPWSYGTMQFDMPWSTKVYGHLMEYVTGKDCLEYAQGLAGDSAQAIEAFHVNCYKTFIEIHNRDVYHGDIHSPNMKLLKPVDPLNPNFVVFDFTLSGSISECSARGLTWRGRELDAMTAFMALAGHDAWFEAGNHQVWTKEFLQMR